MFGWVSAHSCTRLLRAARAAVFAASFARALEILTHDEVPAVRVCDARLVVATAGSKLEASVIVLWL